MNKIDNFIVTFTDKVLTNYSQSIERSAQNSFAHGVLRLYFHIIIVFQFLIACFYNASLLVPAMTTTHIATCKKIFASIPAMVAQAKGWRNKEIYFLGLLGLFTVPMAPRCLLPFYIQENIKTYLVAVLELLPELEKRKVN